jgi:fibronectin type 3 domain-containing protein
LAEKLEYIPPLHLAFSWKTAIIKPNMCRTGTRKGKIKLKKRLLSILLAAVMVLTMLPLGLVETAWAASSGTCGDKLTWSLSDDGTLTISGTGKMKDYGDNYGMSVAPWYVGSSQVKTVIIEDGVTSIGDRAFDGCTKLTRVVIPDSVTSIGYGSFRGCYSLPSVAIPDSVTSIGDSAFAYCKVLTGITLSGSVTSIGSCAFQSCDSLTSVTMQNGVTDIGDNAFTYCKNLTSVTIPNSVKTIGTSAFYNCAGLTRVTIPSSVTRIEQDTFKGCSGLTSVTISAGVTSIESGAFRDCTSLTSVTIPGSVTSIEGYAFAYCSALTSLIIHDGTTSIGISAFMNCTSLGSVTIPRSVTDIGGYAFGSCRSLADVYYGGTETDWTKITIGNGNGNLTSATLHCAPAAPVVRIGNSATSGKPVLTWNAVYGATSYRIYRSTSKGSGYSLLGTTTATSYTNTGAKAGTTYYYRVKACNDAGLSPYSNIVSGQVKTVTPKPAAPVVKIGNSASSGKPMLTWNAVSGATSYKVYRATSQNGTYSLLGTVTATSYTNTGAKAGTTYYYKVKAVNSAGESAYSNVVSGRATVTTLTMGHSSTSGKPQLTWKAVSGATSYKVYRATTKNGAYSVINTTKARTYTNTGAALGTTYYYKVEALNAAGKSMGFSAVVDGKVAPVLAVGYSSVSGKPQLTWKAVPGATEYQVYRSTQQNSGYSKINTTTATSYVNTGAKAGTTYYYRIVAVKGTAVSDFSNIVSARPGK